MWIARDKIGTRLSINKPEWSGEYFCRQQGQEFPVPDESHNLEIGECKKVTAILTEEGESK